MAPGPPVSRAPRLDPARHCLPAARRCREARSELFTDQVFTDFTMPTWRLQATGSDDSIALRRRGHPGASCVVRHRISPTRDGFVIELEESSGTRATTYCREMIAAMLHGVRISELLSVCCTGDWSSARQAEHAAAVRLLRD
jgi:hypothetical protein